MIPTTLATICRISNQITQIATFCGESDCSASISHGSGSNCRSHQSRIRGLGCSVPNAPRLAPIHSLEVCSPTCFRLESLLSGVGEDSRVCQLQTAIRAVSLEGKSMDEYLHKIKGYVDELAGVGVPVLHEEYLDAILEGLPSDYALVISVIESKKRTPSIAEIEALLYGHETCLVRYDADTLLLTSPSLNYTQGYSHSSSYKSGDSGGFRGVYGRGTGGRGAFSDRGGPGRGRGGGKFVNFQCQICLKYGHTANVCHF